MYGNELRVSAEGSSLFPQFTEAIGTLAAAYTTFKLNWVDWNSSYAHVHGDLTIVMFLLEILARTGNEAIVTAAEPAAM